MASLFVSLWKEIEKVPLMKKAVSYCRVSHLSQYENGTSLDAQKAKIEAMCVVQDLELVETIIDGGESAKSLNRPGMQRLLGLVANKEIDVVIIWKLDRLTRSIRDLGELLELFERKSVSLLSLNESLDTASAAGRLVINIMISVSQWEREVIGERTSFALQHLKSQGKRVGQINYGYQLSEDGEHLEPDAHEQEILCKIKKLKGEGKSLSGIAEALNIEGFRTRRGGNWAKQGIHNIVKSSNI
jgi:DNA invertase Pin-like site-specific DNA recombinase